MILKNSNNFFEPYIIIKGGPDPMWLAARKLPELECFHPGAILKTSIAAAFLGVHRGTLLRWVRSGRGPCPIDRDSYQGRGYRWQLGALIQFWESNNPATNRVRTYAEIWEDWLSTQTLPLFPLPLEFLATKPTAKQRRRQKADLRRRRV